MKKLLTSAFIAILLVGCGDFGSTNVDPNDPATPRTDLLMTQAQRGVGDNVSAVTGTLYIQYFSETQYTDASTYASNRADWDGWYAQPLQDLQTIIDLNSDEETQTESYVLSGGSNANQIAVARILKAYLFQMITDRWGMVPYSEALQGSENFAPSYDSQEDIYMDLIAELKDAVSQMDSGSGPTGDFIFNGDMDRWTSFANTLRARIALRMSDVDPGTAEAEFTAAVDDGLIEENVMYEYLSDENNDNPWEDRFETRTDYAISVPMVDAMQPLDDMRLTAYAEPAPELDNDNGITELSEIQGMPYGLTQADAGAITNAEVSFPGSAIGYNNPTAPLPIITTAEVNFMLAEAAQRTWITGNAADYYEEAIQDSWEQWNVYEETAFDDYIAQPEVAYDAANWEENIGVQKWIALFPQGYEAWAEWRRLDYPELEPAPAAVSNRDIPLRQGYPASESELNSENYEAAVSEIGEDALSTSVWWDVD